MGGLSRDGDGDGGVMATPDRGVSRAASAGNSGLLNDLGLSSGMGRRGAGGQMSDGRS